MTGRSPSTSGGSETAAGRIPDVVRGRFITVEGIEGVGKTTNIDFLVQAIEEHDLPVLTTREPGGTPAAERIREILVAHGEESVPPVAELLLMFAARSLHVDNVIRPALDSGTWVVCDRFTDASRAYQGGGRQLPEEYVETLATWVHGDLTPDLTVLLDAPVEVGLARAGRRGTPDRFERERVDFFQRVRDVYLHLARTEPDRFVVVNADRDLRDVRADVESIIAALVNKISN